MSDEPSPSSAARLQDSDPDVGPDDDATGDGGPDRASRSSRPLGSGTGRRRRKKKASKKKNNNPGLTKKLSFITHLLSTLDVVVFAELSSLYYMECSMFRFIIRSVGQYIYLTPKDQTFPFAMPARRMHVIIIIIPNIFCMLLHLFSSLPTGPDYHRGYQHGGVIVDFVGQKPPASKLYYLLVDMVILIVQCLMLTIHTEREKLRISLKTFRPVVPELIQEMAAAPTIEDLDAEERGVPRDLRETTVDETNSIEMQPLGPGDDAGSNGRLDEREPLQRENSNDDTPRTHLSDIMNSGNAVLGEYHVLHGLRNAAMDLEATTAHSLQTISYGATLAMLRSRQGANARLRRAPT